DEQFRKEAYKRLGQWQYCGWLEGYYDYRYEQAREAWSTHPERFWNKTIGSAATGGTVIVIGLFCLPYLVVLLLVGALVLSRGSHTDLAPNQNQLPTIVETKGGSGEPEQLNGDDGQAAIVPDRRIVWPAVVFITVVVTLLDWRRLFWVIRLRFSRAPPVFKGRCAMRTLCLSAIMLVGLAGSTSAKQSLLFQFGEWPNARGSRVVLISETDHLESQPSVFLDGRAFEYLGLFHVTNRLGRVSIGPIVGGSSNDDGFKPYAGAVSRWQVRADSLAVFVQGATRHYHDERISHIVLTGFSYRLDRLIIGVAYQPVLRQPPWDERVALSIARRFKLFALALESRVSLDKPHRTSMNVDVSVPLK
ncbi:MAG: hypothetical protein QME74_09595, partial [Candidatus Edwardsbacteria bacterium]|nr:hypothetical protein [Candidatus Edwardsbacteria bacterium]